MNVESILVLVTLGLAFVVLVTEWVRADVVALLVLLGLTLTGLVEPAEAVSGFSSAAVIAVCGILVLSAGLQRAGIATLLGNGLVRLGGRGEIRLVAAIMATAALLSFFMNTLAIVALLLPASMDLSRRTGVAPSRLLMPLAFGSLLGGLTTLFATLPNLLASTALKDRGLEPFGLFDFLPVGLTATIAGILFVALGGRRLLPVRDLQKESSGGHAGDLPGHYRLHERMFVLRLPPASILHGKSIEESRLGSAFGLHIVAVLRDGRTHLAPGRALRLRERDQLLVQGQPDQLGDLEGWQRVRLIHEEVHLQQWFPAGVDFAEVRLSQGSRFAGQTIAWLDVRRRWGLNVLAVRRGDRIRRSQLPLWDLQSGDRVLVQGPRAQLDALRETAGLEDYRVVSSAELATDYSLEERLFTLELPPDSPLDGRTLAESRLGEALGLTVLAISRPDRKILMPGPDEPLRAQDGLLVQGRSEDLVLLQGIKDLVLEREVAPELSEFESEQFGMVEVVLSPRTGLVGKTLRQIRFRERYGLSVLGIWRAGEARATKLGNLPLAFGDALLVYGPRERLMLLGHEPDFIVLTRTMQKPPRSKKAPIAALVMLVFLIPVAFEWLPIHIAALMGAALMVLLGCLRVEEAYEAVELKAVLLIAGMIPLGLALEKTELASLAATKLVQWVGPLGPTALLGAIFLITAVVTCVLPGTATIVLLAPIVLQTATAASVSPHALMMAAAMAAAGGFLSPIAHPSNVLIMGPGGYRFSDYLRMGIPLSLVVLLVVLLVVPLFWPLTAVPP